jgi:hypothetical protein
MLNRLDSHHDIRITVRQRSFAGVQIYQMKVRARWKIRIAHGVNADVSGKVCAHIFPELSCPATDIYQHSAARTLLLQSSRDHPVDGLIAHAEAFPRSRLYIRRNLPGNDGRHPFSCHSATTPLSAS